MDSNGWQPIETVPFNTPVQVRLGEGMSIVARLLPDASVNDQGQCCDQWQAEFEGEHPECWSDGCCWENNADDCRSMQPTQWRPWDSPLTDGETTELAARINANPNLQPATDAQTGGR